MARSSRHPGTGGGQSVGLMAWFARNHVAANLLMVAIVVTGLLVARRIRQEVYPTFVLDTVEIRMDYRGASPEEVERSVILPIESELRGLELVREDRAIARRAGPAGGGDLAGDDRNRALQEVTAAVQRISLFPDEVEPPVISLDGGRRRGDAHRGLRRSRRARLVDFARQIEDGLLAEPEISLVELRGARRPEILVEVPQADSGPWA